MLYWIALEIEKAGGPAAFRFITTRMMFAFITAFFTGLVVGRPIINWLWRNGIRSRERAYGDINTQSKSGTPLMGGLILVVAGVLAVLLWCDLGNTRVWAVLAAALWFAGIGAWDDLKKARGRDADSGLSRAWKYATQVLFGFLFAAWLIHPATSPFPDLATDIYLPILKNPVVDLSWGFAVFVVLVFLYSANAVNFADGMDGLCIVPSALVLVVLGVFAFVLGNQALREYLLFANLGATGELAVLAAGMVGASMAFLWFNAHPAEAFMGDAGSMMLGGTMAALGLMLKQEAILLLVGGIFLAEILSQMLQERVGLVRGRRYFYRAPFHHTMAHRGMSESKIVVRLWIVSVILAALALLTLKLR